MCVCMHTAIVKKKSGGNFYYVICLYNSLETVAISNCYCSLENKKKKKQLNWT